MTRTLNEVMQSLPLDQQEEIEALAAQLIKEEMENLKSKGRVQSPERGP